MPRYIDADALIDFLDVGHLRHPSELCFSEVDVANLLLHAPTLSPDDVRGVGEWVDKGVRAWSCSCCGTPLNHIRQFASFEKNELPNYCPNCGAKMEETEDAFLARNAVYADREFDHPKYQETLREIVDKEPTLSPDEVRGVGEWIEAAGGNYLVCPECKYDHALYDRLGYSCEHEYCPNCGKRLRMKGAED